MSMIIPALFMVLIVFGALIYPIWMIIHCLTSSSLEGKTKALWFVIIFFTWSLGALLYGLFGCKKKSAPWISSLAIICLGLLSMGPIINMLNSGKQMAAVEFTKVDQMDKGELSPDERVRFKASLETLQAEVKASNLDRMPKAITFAQLLSIYGKDNKITSTEYREWIEKFDARDMLDRDAFSTYVRGKR